MKTDFTKFNKKGRVFTVDTTDFPTRKSAEIFEQYGQQSFRVLGLFITSSEFGEGVAVATDKSVIFFSRSQVDMIREILDCQDAIDDINAGNVTAHIEEFTSRKFGKKGYALVFDPEFDAEPF